MIGRPKKPKADRKTNCLRVMMTDTDRAALDATARASGKETSTWARELLVAAAKSATEANRKEKNE